MRQLFLLLRSALALLLLLPLAFAADASKYPKSITLSYEILSPSSSPVEALATISYDPRTLKYTLSSWTPPSLDHLKTTSTEPTSSLLLRILLPDGSSTVTSLSTFSNDLIQKIDLWVSPEPEGSIFAASVTSSTPPPLSEEEARLRKKIDRARARGKPVPTPSKPKPQKKPKNEDEKNKKKKAKKEEPEPFQSDYTDAMVKVNLIPATPGPTPKLGSRAAPQLDAQGNEILPQNEQQEKSFFQKYWWIFLVAAVLAVGGGGGDK